MNSLIAEPPMPKRLRADPGVGKCARYPAKMAMATAPEYDTDEDASTHNAPINAKG
jgi:hypothetical protein